MKKATILREDRKRGRPQGYSPTADPRATTLQTRFNAAELASLDRLAKRLQSTRSAAIRHAIQKAVESE